MAHVEYLVDMLKRFPKQTAAWVQQHAQELDAPIKKMYQTHGLKELAMFARAPARSTSAGAASTSDAKESIELTDDNTSDGPSASEARVHGAAYHAAMNVLRRGRVKFRSGAEQELSVARFLNATVPPDSCARRRRCLLFLVLLAWCTRTHTQAMGVSSGGRRGSLTFKESKVAEKAVSQAAAAMHEAASRKFFEEEKAALAAAVALKGMEKEKEEKEEEQEDDTEHKDEDEDMASSETSA
jgi:hypothetical protein